MVEKAGVIVARCGLACEVCQHFNQGCPDCEKDNELNSRCLIYKCAQEKNIQYCLQCPQYPCKLIVGLSKAYCPIYSEIKSNIKVLPCIVYDTPLDWDPNIYFILKSA